MSRQSFAEALGIIEDSINELPPGPNRHLKLAFPRIKASLEAAVNSSATLSDAQAIYTHGVIHEIGGFGDPASTRSIMRILALATYINTCR